jgi:hypothetical protein
MMPKPDISGEQEVLFNDSVRFARGTMRLEDQQESVPRRDNSTECTAFSKRFVLGGHKQRTGRMVIASR